MAQVYFGDPELFDAAAYGAPNASIFEFIGRQAQQVSHTLTEAATRFFETTKDVYRKVEYDEALRLAKAVSRRIKSVWDKDGIHPLTNIGQLQNANLTMQRWIMAEPTVRSLFHKQLCEGYHGTYVDMHPDKVGEQHYDFRRATHGFVFLDEEAGWKATSYLDQLLPNDNDLELTDQVDIQTSWNFVKAMIKKKQDDPTSKFNGSL